MNDKLTSRGTGLAERAYQHIKTQLLEARYSDGDWLPVDQISAQMGMSRQPLMEAIKRLASEGFVEIVPQVGSRVCHYSREEMDDFYQLFAGSEALIAVLATERAEPADVTRLRLALQQMNELFRLPMDGVDRGRMYRHLNRQFHTELRRIVRSPQLARIAESLGDLGDFLIASARRPIMNKTPAQEAADMEGLQLDQAEHARLVEAIALGDAPLAKATMEAHIRNTASRMLARINRIEAETLN